MKFSLQLHAIVTKNEVFVISACTYRFDRSSPVVVREDADQVGAVATNVLVVENGGPVVEDEVGGQRRPEHGETNCKKQQINHVTKQTLFQTFSPTLKTLTEMATKNEDSFQKHRFEKIVALFK